MGDAVSPTGDLLASPNFGICDTTQIKLEQWKRIAGRTVHSSPPLSRQYYQTVISTLELQDGQIPQSLGSYRRPGRSENEQDIPNGGKCQWRAPRRRVLLGSFVAVVIVAIVVAVVLAVTIGKQIF